MSEVLRTYLKPITEYLAGDHVTEVCVNRPGEVFVEQAGSFISAPASKLSEVWLEALAMLIAEFNNKPYSSPLIEGRLPDGERVQVVMSPACEPGRIFLSIRKPQVKEITLDDYEKCGAFEKLTISKPKRLAENTLLRLYRQKQMKDFIEEAIKQKKNILISGGTGSGKTTFLNACLKLIPMYERILTIEDTREVTVKQPNAVNLLFNDDDKRISALNVFKASLRLRPDRILLSELRGSEVWPYLRAANSGHPGSLTTVHADNPEGAFTQLVFMMQQAGSNSTEEQIRQYLKSIIHVVVQLKRSVNNARFMEVEDIWFGGEPSLTDPQIESEG